MVSKIAVVGPYSEFGAQDVYMNALVDFLEQRYDVRVYYHNTWRSWDRLWSAVQRRFGGPPLPDFILNRIENEIRIGRFDVVIAAGAGDILLRDLPCKKIFYCHAPLAHEQYFKVVHSAHSGNSGLFEYLEGLRSNELAILKSADYVLVAWKTYEEYIRKHVYDGTNIVSHPGHGWYGCTPQSTIVQYRFPPAIVWLGNLDRYYNNLEMLARLSAATPYLIDVYGPARAHGPRAFRYKGVASNLHVLYQYQFGLNTVTEEILRRNGFSSKILTYLSYGLPCLFSEWERFPHELGGCVPYTEKNFVEVVERCSEKKVWAELSRAAIEQANELRWDAALAPLAKLLE